MKNPATMAKPFPDHREAALALLNGNFRFNRKTGGFLGQLAVDPSPVSAKQANWLAKLLATHGLPVMAPGGAH